MDSEQVIEAARDAVRVIIRRPHAYEFKRTHPSAPIPGLVVLDREGELVGAVRVPSKDAVAEVVELLRR